MIANDSHRRKLATMPFIIPHTQQTDKRLPRGHSTPEGPCAHIFLHPLTWMRPSLFPEQDSSSPTAHSANEYTYSPEAPLSGRLTCPNSACGANIGKFAWQGMKCSCGNWVVPAIGLARARVDVMESSAKRGTTGAAAAIRLPASIEGGGGGAPAAAYTIGARGLLWILSWFSTREAQPLPSSYVHLTKQSRNDKMIKQYLDTSQWRPFFFEDLLAKVLWGACTIHLLTDNF